MPTHRPERGLLIAIEGGEGAGKTTQAERLTRRLNEAGNPAIMTREPGGTPLGNHLRNYLKGQGPIGLKAETLLFIAARAQSVEQTIIPALNSGISVVSDRHQASTAAYQGAARRGNIQFIHQLNAYATGGLEPDLTILLDLPPQAGLQRTQPPQIPMSLENSGSHTQPRIDQPGQRRFEEQPIAFHNRVRQGYLQLAQDNPAWRIIDASNTPEQVETGIWQAVAKIHKPRQ